MGSSWWRAPICLLKTARCICAPPRAAAGGCDLSPHRRRLARPAGLPRRFDARRPGLLSVYRAGGVVLANAIGTGVADDKSIYPYVPEMIRFYLGEQPILSNIPTWRCRKAEDLRYVLSNLELMVVKEVHGAGATACWSARVPPKRSGRPSASACWPIRPTISPRHPRAVDLPHLR